jgi:hypothetical protein
MDGRWSPVRRSGSAGLRSFCNLATAAISIWSSRGCSPDCGKAAPTAAGRFERAGIGCPDLADRAIFLSLPHNQEALPVELRGARASMACQHPTTPRGSAAVLSRNRAKSPERAFCPAGHFLHAYRANRRSAIEEVVDADEVAARIRDTWPSGAVWKGNATELLRVADERARASLGWEKPVQRQQPLRPFRQRGHRSKNC